MDPIFSLAEEFIALSKKDGHLSIIFNYGGNLVATTRGEFTSPSSCLANEILARHVAEDGWLTRVPENLTVLCELVGKRTKIHLTYRGPERFVLIGARDRVTFEDYRYEKLKVLGRALGIKVTEVWKQGKSADELLSHVHDPTVRGQEGFVASFYYPDGTVHREKFKFVWYLGQMAASKLSYAYLVSKILNGRLKSMIDLLDHELRDKAEKMVEELRAGVAAAKLVKIDEELAKTNIRLATHRLRRARNSVLYACVPEKKRSNPFKTACRDLTKLLEKKPDLTF
ncbi:MAG: hypothetical protein WC797_03880 [Candidatus Paceibacterota bacterium]|jgi:hypothetical protein